MKRITSAVSTLMLTCMLMPSLGRAQEKGSQLGVGAYIGTPFGLSAKYLIDERNAVDMALGAQGGDFDIHFDILTHFRGLSPQPPAGKLAPYLGLGLKFKNEEDEVFGIRFLGGMAYIIKDTPVEVFAEIAPVLRLVSSLGSNLDGGVGVRYYFNLGQGPGP